MKIYLFLLLLLVTQSARALPLYTAREGRTCDNCHTLPNKWTNPEAAKERKCTLSCSACHIDPAGGGMRNTAGRFYGQSDLPMTLVTYRNYKDTVRHVLPALKGIDQKERWAPAVAFGDPLGEAPKMAPTKDRYGALNADPLLSVGLDARFASWFTGEDAVLSFPMQLDTQVALHPVHHVTAYVNAGVLAKEKGYTATFQGEPVFAPKDIELLIHELPYNTYLKVGRFIPPFGMRLDDHTSYTRRDFELDSGIQGSRVVGAEIGFAPNYPYAHLAVFRPNVREEFPNATGAVPPSFFGVEEGGIGAAISAGYRELGWQLGGSAMIRKRELSEGGDTSSVSVQWGLNPWFYSDKLPITYTGEYSLGFLQRVGNGSQAFQAASTQEINYSPYNGINLKLKYDHDDPDFAVAANHQSRIGLGADLTFIPGLRLTMMGRLTVLPGGIFGSQTDFFMFLRAWL